MILSPICLFTYNRASETQKTIEALRENYLAPRSKLFIFSDGPKDNIGAEKVKEVRQYIKNIDGFESITIFESSSNKGLANSIISGVTKIIDQYGKVIVLEDDLITSRNFLDFMNQALSFYNGHPRVHSVSGYTLDLPSLKKYPKDYYIGYRASSWGWGTWKDKWETIDWGMEKYNAFRKNPFDQIKFMRGGSDMPRMLKNQMKGRIDSWAIRWCFDQFCKNQFSIISAKSKIVNIGIGNNATHTKKNLKRFNTTLDIGLEKKFKFDYNIKLNNILIKESKNKFSFYNRLKENIQNNL